MSLVRCPVCDRDALVTSVESGGERTGPWRLTTLACGDWLREEWRPLRGGGWEYKRTGGGENTEPCLPVECPPLEET